MISFINVFVKYTKEFYALSNINLKINRGESLCVLGEKDSGKTCLLRLLAGLEKPDKGEIYIKDIPYNKVDYRADISMGYIPYKANFFNNKTVRQNLEYVLKIRKFEKAQIEELVNNVLIDFRLESIAEEKIYKLSLFQKYLVSVARLSFRKLDIVLVDNIFEELTLEENKELLKLFKKYFVNKNTLFMFATSSEKIARNIALRIVHLENGVITLDEPNTINSIEEKLKETSKVNINKNSETNKVNKKNGTSKINKKTDAKK